MHPFCRTLAPALLLAGFLVAPPAAAAPVEPGSRVRVTILARAAAESLALPAGVAPGDRLVGTLLSAGPRGLGLEVGGGPDDTLTVPRELIAQFETQAGRHGRAGRGAGIGLVAGIAAGFAFAQYFISSEGVSRDVEAHAFRFGFVTVGALGGLGLGALVGSFAHKDTWRRADIPAAR